MTTHKANVPFLRKASYVMLSITAVLIMISIILVGKALNRTGDSFYQPTEKQESRSLSISQKTVDGKQAFDKYLVSSGNTVYTTREGKIERCTITVVNPRYALMAKHCSDDGALVSGQYSPEGSSSAINVNLGTAHYLDSSFPGGLDVSVVSLRRGFTGVPNPVADKYPAVKRQITTIGSTSNTQHARVLSPPDRLKEYENVSVVDGLAQPGDSGGPAFDGSGKIVGIVTLTIKDRGMGGITDITKYRDEIDRYASSLSKASPGPKSVIRE